MNLAAFLAAGGAQLISAVINGVTVLRTTASQANRDEMDRLFLKHVRRGDRLLDLIGKPLGLDDPGPPVLASVAADLASSSASNDSGTSKV